MALQIYMGFPGFGMRLDGVLMSYFDEFGYYAAGYAYAYGDGGPSEMLPVFADLPEQDAVEWLRGFAAKYADFVPYEHKNMREALLSYGLAVVDVDRLIALAPRALCPDDSCDFVRWPSFGMAKLFERYSD